MIETRMVLSLGLGSDKGLILLKNKRLIKRTTLRINHYVYYGLQVIMMCQCRFTIVINVPGWWKMLIIKEAMLV